MTPTEKKAFFENISFDVRRIELFCVKVLVCTIDRESYDMVVKARCVFENGDTKTVSLTTIGNVYPAPFAERMKSFHELSAIQRRRFDTAFAWVRSQYQRAKVVPTNELVTED